jgi:hypothetical protein
VLEAGGEAQHAEEKRREGRVSCQGEGEGRHRRVGGEECAVRDGEEGVVLFFFWVLPLDTPPT